MRILDPTLIILLFCENAIAIFKKKIANFWALCDVVDILSQL